MRSYRLLNMGLHKKIPTPDIMWEHFTAYRKDIESNPIMVVEQKKGNTIVPKDFEGDIPQPIVMLPHKRPLTLEGFENWCADNNIIGDLSHYFCNLDNRYAEFIAICSRIRRVIKQDQIEGGMVGIYNPSITQRLNGLVDKKELDHKGQINIPNLPDIGTRK